MKSHKIRNTSLGILGAIVLIIVIVSVANSGSPGTSTGSGSSASSAPEPSAPPKAAAGLGSKVRDGKFEFVVTSVSHAKSVGDPSAGGQSAQGEYTILHLTVTNISGQPQDLADSAQYVYDSSGRKFGASSDADITLSEQGSQVLLNQVNPGNTVSGEIAFDMPARDGAVTAELHDSPFSGGVKVSLK